MKETKDAPVKIFAGSEKAGMTENELREYRQARNARRRRRGRHRRRIIGAAVAVVAFLYAFFNWDKLAPASVSASVRSFFGIFASGQFPLTYSSGNFKGAVPIGSNFAVLTDSAITLYTPAGAQVWQHAHGMSNPSVVANGGRAVLFDRGGKQFRVETRFGEPFSASTDYPIVTACVGQSGKFAVVSESGSYLSEVNVYDASYHSVFKWYSSQGRVLDAALSPDGKSMAAVTVGAKDGAITSTLNVFRLGSQKAVASRTVTGTLFYSLQYTSSGRIAAVGDNRTDFFTSDGKKDTTYSYDNRTLLSYYNAQGHTALALSAFSAGSQSTLVAFSGEGRVAGNKNISGEVTELFANGSRVAALRAGDVWYGTAACKPLGTVAAAGDPLEIECLSKHIYVFSLQSVNRYAVKGS